MSIRKKMAACVSALLFMVASHALAGTVYLGSGDIYLPESWPSSGWIPASYNWVIAVYQDGGNDVIDLWGSGTSDDSFLFSLQGSAWADDGLLGGSFTSDGSVDLFARIYNASDFVNDSNIGSATEYVNLSNGIESIPPLAGNGIHNWNAGGSAENGSDWLPIPEPATLSLFGLGLMMLGLRKRIRK